MSDTEKKALNDDGNSDGENQKKDLEDNGQTSKDQKGDDDSKNLGDSNDEMITISKSDYDKLLDDKENYRKGMLSAKTKNRQLPGSKPDNSKSVAENVDDDDDDKKDKIDTSNFVTREEQRKNNEEQAMALADRDPDMPHLVEHWDEVVSKFDESTSRDSVLQVLSGIKSAYNKWAKENPDKAAKEDKKKSIDDAKDAKSKISSDNPSKGTFDKTVEQRDKVKKSSRSILPEKKSMDDWYGSKK